VEETNYYPFGLAMAGISSKAAGKLENKKKFNGIEYNADLDVNTYDAFYRNLDPQIGRFLQIDPKIESAEAWSPYSAMLNNPIRYMDPLGDSTVPGAGFWANVGNGIADGWQSTKGFVKSLGTSEGWKNLGNGVANAFTSTSTYDVATGTKFSEIATQKTAFSPENAGTQQVTRDNVGHAIGYGLEKTAEAVVLSKGAGVVKNALGGAEVVNATKTAGQLGREGMAATGIEQNTTRIPSATGTAAYRVPDGLNVQGKVLSEVKNVATQSYTNQIKDYVHYSQQNGYSFDLYLRPTTQITQPLQTQITNGTINLKILPH